MDTEKYRSLVGEDGPRLMMMFKRAQKGSEQTIQDPVVLLRITRSEGLSIQMDNG